MIGQNTITQITRGNLPCEPIHTGIMAPVIATISGPDAPKHHGGPKGDQIIPEATEGDWTCYKCKTKNEDGRIICKHCGTRN